MYALWGVAGCSRRHLSILGISVEKVRVKTLKRWPLAFKLTFSLIKRRKRSFH
jgi:hypothetical protein